MFRQDKRTKDRPLESHNNNFDINHVVLIQQQGQVPETRTLAETMPRLHHWTDDHFQKKSTRTTKEIRKHIQVVGGPLCPTPPTLERTTCTKICKLGFAARRLKAGTNFQTFNVWLSAWKCAFFTRPLVASFMILTSTLFFWSEKWTFWYQTSEWSALFYTVETFVYL